MPSPIAGVVMGFDCGTRVLGIAVGQGITGTARPVATLGWAYPPRASDWERLHPYILQWDPRQLVVGIPWTETGERQWTTDLAEDFATALKARYPDKQVVGVDESLTTRAAHWQQAEQASRAPRRPGRMDAWAASVLVEAYLREPRGLVFGEPPWDPV